MDGGSQAAHAPGDAEARPQQLLASAEERLRDWESLRETSGYGFIEFGLDGRFTFANAAAEKIFGRTASQIVGRHFREVILESYWPRADAEIARLFGGGPSCPEEYEMFGADGDVRTVEISARPILRAGRPAGLRCLVVDVSERNRALAALRESEERFRSFVRDSNHGYLELDLGMRIVWANPAGIAMAGLRADDLIGRSVLDFMPASEHDRARADLALALSEPNAGPREYPLVDAAGRTHSVEINALPLRRQGEVRGFQVTLADVTERRRAEERLRAQNRHNRLRAEIWRLAADQALSEDALIQRLLASIGPELDVSRACYNLVDGQELRCALEWCAPGVSATLGTTGPLFLAELAAAEGLTVLDRDSALALAPPELRPAAERLVASMAGTFGVESLAILPCRIGGELEGFVTLDVCTGSPRGPEWLEAERSLVVEAVQVISQTIARRRAERALRESAERHRALIEHIPAVTYTAALDEASTTLYVSPQVLELLGVTPADYVADPDRWRGLLHPEDRDRVMAEVHESHRTGRSLAAEYRMVRTDGRTVWVRDEAGVVSDDAGRPLFLQGVMSDITARKEAQEELQRANLELERRVRERTAELEERHADLLAANRELERLHRAKDEFVAMISHELRTPLVTGMGYVELLLEGHLGPVSPETAAGMQVALRNLRRLASLIDDILSYHSLIRRDRGRGPVLTACRPAEMLRECREEFLVRSGRDAAGVVLEGSPSVPAVLADEDMVRRVISNLLDNADRHAGEGARIRLGCGQREDGGIRFWVSDDGRGMSADVQARVFEPFVKLSGKHEGVGLGLAIVRSVLDAHGCVPQLVSAPGQGTEISFTLPAAPPGPGG